MKARSSGAAVILVASVALQLCLGAHYAWSVFAQELRGHFGFTMVQCQVIYASFHLMFTVVLVAGGRLTDRVGPRWVALAGGVLFSIAYAVAGWDEPTFLRLLVCIGLLGGTGVGLAYLCPIATAQKWFPDRKPLVTGVAVAGFGLGAFFLALLAEGLLKNGIALRDIFRVFGAGFFAVTVAASLFLRNPPGWRPESVRRVPLRGIVFSAPFLLLYFAMFAGLFSGLTIAGNLKPMAVRWGVTGFAAAAGVSFFAFFNGFGRVIWGFITQRITERWTIVAALLAQSVVLGLGIFAVHSSAAYLVFAILLGFNYSATLIVFASSVSKMWGVERLGSVYPVLFTTNGIAGIVAPIFAGRVFDSTGTYSAALAVASLICLMAGLVFLWKGRTEPKDAAEGR